MEIKEITSLKWLLTQDAYEIYKQCMYKATFSEYADEIKRMWETPDYHVFVCAESDENTGIIILKTAEKDAAEIAGIAVKKELQKSGVGKFLVLSAARSLNVKAVFAETDDEAVGFYEHTDFTIKPFVKHFSDGDVVRYKCRLSI